MEKYGKVKATFGCYYNMDNEQEAILEIKQTLVEVVMKILWPGLAVTISLIILVALVVWKGSCYAVWCSQKIQG